MGHLRYDELRRLVMQQKVQLREEDLAFIEGSCEDKRRLRELKRQRAMAAYAGDFEVAFEEIEAEDFE
jgi:hypothetical protein